MLPHAHLEAWRWFTRLGEATLLLPVAAAVCAALWPQAAQRGLVRRWLGALLPMAVLTIGSKIAFMGWGLGSARLDFTGISGHAMFASAVLPVLTHLGDRAWRGAQATATGAGTRVGAALALLVAVSRVEVGAHSGSEVLAGLFAGGLVSGCVLARVPVPGVQPWHRAAVAALALSLPLAMAWAPPSRTHDWVTRLALEASGRREPWHRWQLKAGAGETRPGGGPPRRWPAEGPAEKPAGALRPPRPPDPAPTVRPAG